MLWKRFTSSIYKICVDGRRIIDLPLDEACAVNKVKDSNLGSNCVATSRVEKFQKAVFNEYVAQSKQPVMKAALALYQELLQNNWAIIFITGRDEEARSYTSKNLRDAGYESWAELILRYSMFLEHSDANRALMGWHMRRQAVRLSKLDFCIVGPGMKSQTLHPLFSCIWIIHQDYILVHSNIL